MVSCDLAIGVEIAGTAPLCISRRRPGPPRQRKPSSPRRFFPAPREARQGKSPKFSKWLPASMSAVLLWVSWFARLSGSAPHYTTPVRDLGHWPMPLPIIARRVCGGTNPGHSPQKCSQACSSSAGSGAPFPQALARPWRHSVHSRLASPSRFLCIRRSAKPVAPFALRPRCRNSTKRSLNRSISEPFMALEWRPAPSVSAGVAKQRSQLGIELQRRSAEFATGWSHRAVWGRPRFSAVHTARNTAHAPARTRKVARAKIHVTA